LLTRLRTEIVCMREDTAQAVEEKSKDEPETYPKMGMGTGSAAIRRGGVDE
jgi:hypothetical protein